MANESVIQEENDFNSKFESKVVKLTLDVQLQNFLKELEQKYNLSGKKTQKIIYKLIEKTVMDMREYEKSGDVHDFLEWSKSKHEKKLIIDYLYDNYNLLEIYTIRDACNDIINLKLKSDFFKRTVLD